MTGGHPIPPKATSATSPPKQAAIKGYLNHAEAAKYYHNGFLKDWEDSPKDLAAQEAESEASQAKAAETMVANLT